MCRQFVYKSEQRLAFAEYGNPTGYPVLAQHGLIASIRDGGLFRRLVEAGVRVIGLARPGYGESSPFVLRDMAEWGDVVAALAAELGLTQFDVLGISSGAPYSYAIGYRLPERVRNIYILSGTPALYDARVAALWPYPLDKSASLSEYQKLTHELFFAPLSAKDAQRQEMLDSGMNHGFGIAQDFKLRCNDWGFCLADVMPLVHMQHSRDDDHVPFETAEITAGLLPNCRFSAREQGGHFSGALADAFFDTVLAAYSM